MRHVPALSELARWLRLTVSSEKWRKIWNAIIVEPRDHNADQVFWVGGTSGEFSSLQMSLFR